jgi:hypothetical protein|tara:strand:+ start:102 stop:293 length:192 start_codon:yes stop_codon:yes gene_type:complete
MFTIWIHAKAFFTVVVVSCAHPINWEHCVRVDQWLIPDLVYAWELKTGQRNIYENEKQYLLDK